MAVTAGPCGRSRGGPCESSAHTEAAPAPRRVPGTTPTPAAARGTAQGSLFPKHDAVAATTEPRGAVGVSCPEVAAGLQRLLLLLIHP